MLELPPYAEGIAMRMILAAAALSLAGCVGTPVVTTASAGCSSLIPSAWAAGVAGAPLPDGDEIADWIVFGDSQTGKLDQANARTKDAIELQQRCEARDKAAVTRATRGWFGRLFG